MLEFSWDKTNNYNIKIMTNIIKQQKTASSIGIKYSSQVVKDGLVIGRLVLLRTYFNSNIKNRYRIKYKILKNPYLTIKIILFLQLSNLPSINWQYIDNILHGSDFHVNSEFQKFLAKYCDLIKEFIFIAIDSLVSQCDGATGSRNVQIFYQAPRYFGRRN